MAFPSAPDKEAAWLEVMRKEVAPQVKQLALDRFTAALEMADLDRETKAVVLKNDPPRIVFKTTPSILVYVDGAPAYRPVKDVKLERVVNTGVLLLRDGKGVHYLRVFDGWMKAPALDGELGDRDEAVQGLRQGPGRREGVGPGGLPDRRQPERRRRRCRR